MSNPNKSYFDKYTDPVVREIDRVNIYEFENGMDYELTQSGKAINVDTIKEAQGKVLKNLKKDANYYTNMLTAESIKMVGEYGSGKKPGKRETAKSAEAVKKDGKMPKANKQDAPYGAAEKNEMVKVKSLKESIQLRENMDLLIQLDKLIKSNPDLAALPLTAIVGMLGHKIGHKVADKISPIAKKEAYKIDNAATEQDPAEYMGGQVMPEEYVPLKDRPVPPTKELDKEWEKRKPGFMKSMGDQLKMGKTNEDVNVADSRTIKLTPTTKNKVLTLIHELTKEAFLKNPKTGQTVAADKPSSVSFLRTKGYTEDPSKSDIKSL